MNQITLILKGVVSVIHFALILMTGQEFLLQIELLIKSLVFKVTLLLGISFRDSRDIIFGL